MWYSIKKLNYNFEIEKLYETDEPIEAWFTKVYNCGLEESEIEINKQVGNSLKMTLPQCTTCNEVDETYGLYTLHIKIGDNLYDNFTFPYYPQIFDNLITDLENLFCGCPCPKCKDCVEEKELLNITFKTLFYYTLSGTYYQHIFGQALKCIDCDLTKEQVCLLLNEKIYGNYQNKTFLKRLLAIFYLSFYYAEVRIDCDLDFINSKFKIKEIKKCLENLGIDLQCISNSIKNLKPTTGDNFIHIENRDSVVITQKYFLETSPPYFDPEQDQIKAIIITDLQLDEGLNNGTTTKASLTINGQPVKVGDIINFSDIMLGKLVYTARDTNRSGESWFTWDISNGC